MLAYVIKDKVYHRINYIPTIINIQILTTQLYNDGKHLILTYRLYIPHISVPTSNLTNAAYSHMSI